METVDDAIRVLGTIPFIVVPFLIFNWFKMIWILFKNKGDFELLMSVSFEDLQSDTFMAKLQIALEL